MTTREEALQPFHRAARAVLRLFCGNGWTVDQARPIQAGLHAVLLTLLATDNPPPEVPSLLDMLAHTDYFDPAIRIDRAPLLERILGLRERLLLALPAERRPGTRTTWAGADGAPCAAAIGVHAPLFGGVPGAALARLSSASLALDRHAIVSVTDRRGTIIHVNDQFCQVSGYARDDLIGANHRILKSGRHPDTFYRQMWTALLDGQVWQGDLCNRRKDGALYWVKSTIAPIRDDQGRALAFLSLRTDVTALKATGERLELFERAVHASTSGIFMTDATRKGGPLTYVSPSICALTGYRAHELIGRGIDALFGDRGDARAALAIAHAITAGVPAEITLQGCGKDGRPYAVDLRLSPVHGGDGVLTHFVGIVTDITELERTRQDLQDREERLRRSQAYANIGTWDADVETGRICWSERIGSLFGYAPGALETTYDHFIAAVHPDDRHAVIVAVAVALESGQPLEFEHRCIWPDGSVHWLQSRGDVTRDGDGKALRILGVIQDVTQRSRTEAELRRSQSRLVEAQRLSKIGDWAADLQAGTMHWSPVVHDIYGQDPAVFAPGFDAFRRAVHPGDHELVDEAVEALALGHPLDLMFRIVRPAGDQRWVHQRANPEMDDAGRLVRLVGTTQDVTERVQLQEHSHLLRRVADTTEQAIGIADQDGKLLFVNPAYARMLGRAAAACVGTPMLDHFAASCREQVARTMAQGNEMPLSRRELRMRRHDGSELVTMGNLGVVPGVRGDVRNHFHVFSDYSEELGRQDELRQAKEKAERANDAKSAFLSSMSHELRTPMNAVLGFAQLLEMRGELSPTNRQYVGHILKAGKHLLDLIGEVLDLARVEAGRHVVSLESVDVPLVLEETIALLQPVAQQAGIALQARSGPGCTVRADRIRLKQVFTNLLSNAIKYNRPGGSATVSAHRRLDDDAVTISVADTGPGISGANLAHLFEPFNRLGADESGVEGTGIGLTISKRLVELMGGSISVESAPGIGSTFSVTLPAARASVQELPGPAPAPERPAPRGEPPPPAGSRRR